MGNSCPDNHTHDNNPRIWPPEALMSSPEVLIRPPTPTLTPKVASGARNRGGSFFPLHRWFRWGSMECEEVERHPRLSLLSWRGHELVGGSSSGPIGGNLARSCYGEERGTDSQVPHRSETPSARHTYRVARVSAKATDAWMCGVRKNTNDWTPPVSARNSVWGAVTQR